MEKIVSVKKMQAGFAKRVVVIFLLSMVLLLTGCATKPASVLDKMEKAYNDRDLSGIIECFEPSVQQSVEYMTYFMDGFAGINGLSDLLPFVSQAAEMYADDDDWGTMELKEISTQISGDLAIVNCNFTITSYDGNANSFDGIMHMKKEKNNWYIAVDQSILDAANMQDNQQSSEDSDEDDELAAGKSVKNKLLISAEPFINGYSWVKYEEEDTTYTVLVDVKGDPVSEIYDDQSIKFTSPVIDDTSVVILNSGESLFSIIDTKKNTLYTHKKDGKYEEEYILAHGDGYFVIVRHIAGFDENYWAVGAVNSRGEIVSDFVKLPSDTNIISQSANSYSSNDWVERNIGKGVFDLYDIYSLALGAYYDAVNNATYYNLDIELRGAWLTPFDDNGVAYFHNYASGRENSGIALIERSSFPSYTIIADPEFPSHAWGGIGLKSNTSLPWDGSMQFGILSNNGIYQIKGDAYSIHDFPGLSPLTVNTDKKYVLGYFNDGYAPVALQGADGNNYTSIVDESGTLLFEPIQASSESLFVKEGYLLFINPERYYQLVDINGNIRNLALSEKEVVGISDISDGHIAVQTRDKSAFLLNVKNESTIGLVGFQ